jgi:proline dehydrogenase
MGNMESVNETNNDAGDPLLEALNFGDTKIAFSYKTNQELKKSALLFRLMNNPNLVKIGSHLSLIALKLRIPLTQYVIKKTIFSQFVGGESLLDCQKTIDLLNDYNTLTILDYGAEGKTSEAEFDAVMFENFRAIEMAASNNSVPIISIKVTGLASNDILEKLHSKTMLSEKESQAFDKVKDRVNRICNKGAELGVGIFIDAEETWIQNPIDDLALEMMRHYNKSKVIVYNTYQMYLVNKLEQLKSDHSMALQEEFFLGAKLVRGAYMDKERRRASEKGYKSPVQPDKLATDNQYDESVIYCLDNYESIGFCSSTHNANSNLKQAQLIEERGLDKSHPHINFCQLYGMSDYITFNLVNAGYNVAKYVPYGPVKEVIPYLIRRAEENSSVTGEMSRELGLIMKEVKRRKL